jgi:hypothetical protein
MTQPLSVGHIEYTADGVGASFTYNFKIVTSAELEVRINGSLRTEDIDYTVSGAGGETGGTVTFLSPPADDAAISLRLVQPLEQVLDLLPNTALPAQSLEDTLDRIVRMLQTVREELSRRPALSIGVAAVLRDLFFPAPAPLKLWGWNATADAISYFDAAIATVVPSLTSQLTFIQGSVEVSPTGGEIQLTASSFLPAGSIIWAVTGRVTVALGATNSLTTWSLGVPGDASAFGSGHARTALTVTNVGQHVAPQLRAIPTAQNVVITADGGAFDATGTIILTYSGFTLTPALTV